MAFAFASIHPAMSQKPAPALGSLHTDAASEALLQAMRDELDRSKSQLKMENVPAPYYIEYRLSDSDEYDAEAAFGALRLDQRVHARSIRVVVRVGDYKQDSYYGPGVGAVKSWLRSITIPWLSAGNCGSPPTRPTKPPAKRWP